MNVNEYLPEYQPEWLVFPCPLSMLNLNPHVPISLTYSRNTYSLIKTVNSLITEEKYSTFIDKNPLNLLSSNCEYLLFCHIKKHPVHDNNPFLRVGSVFCVAEMYSQHVVWSQSF